MFFHAFCTKRLPMKKLVNWFYFPPTQGVSALNPFVVSFQGERRFECVFSINEAWLSDFTWYDVSCLERWSSCAKSEFERPICPAFDNVSRMASRVPIMGCATEVRWSIERCDAAYRLSLPSLHEMIWFVASND